ncbi:MAG: pseudouridine synthase [Cyanobacteria bacterium J083]|nr:MAG: pseudouridine synthase [Cyanobacteria bacterium J083]
MKKSRKNRPNYRYILFYKPYGVLCQFTDNSNPENPRLTLKDYIPVKNVYSVGRLDLDSEGLLLLTDDGKLKHLLSHRQFAHPRTYWVQVERIPDATALDKLRQGIQIKDYQTRPAKVRLLPQEPNLPPRTPPIRDRKTVPTCWLEITLTEGRNRQVRRMTAAVGYPTLRLVRVAMSLRKRDDSPLLTLDGLKPGEWRDLTETERQSLISCL